MIRVNSRILTDPTTGVQRYLTNILARCKDNLVTISPKLPLHGFRGHLWEQTILPVRCSGDLLWNPSNTGPIAYARSVVTIHDMAAIDHPEWFTPRFSKWYSYLLPRIIRRAIHVITVSEFSKERIIAHVGENVRDKITVVPNGVDIDIREKSLPNYDVNEKYGIPDRPYFFTLSTLEPRKNLSRVLEAWSLIVKETEACLVVGGGMGKLSIHKRVELQSYPRVHFIGRVNDDDLASLYSRAIAFLYPALYEGFGLPPLEAMACGSPVITSNATSIPEVVGDSAILVNPLDTRAISSAMRLVETDSTLRATLIQKALRQSKKYSWEQTAESTMHILNEVSQN